MKYVFLTGTKFKTQMETNTEEATEVCTLDTNMDVPVKKLKSLNQYILILFFRPGANALLNKPPEKQHQRSSIVCNVLDLPISFLIFEVGIERCILCCMYSYLSVAFQIFTGLWKIL